jgi:hypothetical protein
MHLILAETYIMATLVALTVAQITPEPEQSSLSLTRL